jgi:hypothetical protein
MTPCGAVGHVLLMDEITKEDVTGGADAGDTKHIVKMVHSVSP